MQLGRQHSFLWFGVRKTPARRAAIRAILSVTRTIRSRSRRWILTWKRDFSPFSTRGATARATPESGRAAPARCSGGSAADEKDPGVRSDSANG